jgi:predicted nucleic acid-binding protein
VTRFIVLDSGPLGLVTHPQRNTEVVAITDWLARCLLAGDRIIVPAIVFYELKRELLRANKTIGLARLERFVGLTPGRYLPLSDEALQLAAELWATARQHGKPTADVKDLDVDVILAAQALSFGPAPADIVIATTNERHLSQFVSAKNWTEIVSPRD